MPIPQRILGVTTAALAVLLLVLTQGCGSTAPATGAAAPASGASSEVKLMVLYPQPLDVEQFEDDYRAHLRLLHQELGIPEDERPYRVTRFLPTPDGPAPFYQLFTMTFESAEALQQARARPGFRAVGADAARISTGGAPVVLIGTEK